VYLFVVALACRRDALYPTRLRNSLTPLLSLLFYFTFSQATTARTLLSFVNERTQKKILITNNLDKVCTELGWDKSEVEECGGVTDFMHKHEKAGTSMIFED